MSINMREKDHESRQQYLICYTMRIPRKIISLRLAVAVIVDVMLFSSSSTTSPLVSSLALALSVSSLLWSTSSSSTTENNYRTTTGSSCNSSTSSTTESYSMATVFAFSSSVSAFASSASSLRRRRSATSNADIVARAGISNNNGLQQQQQQQQQQQRRATQQVSASLLVLQANTKPDWLEESMKEFNKDQNKNDDSSTSNNCDINTNEDDIDSHSADGTTNNIRLRTILKAMKKTSGSSLVGFAVDPAVGFCAILVVDDGDNARGGFFPVVISTRDRDQLTSPEALTLVQLAGGLDLGTPILPPDLLAKLVTEEEENEDDEDDDTIPAVVAAVAAATVGQRITLTSIETVLDPTSPTNDDTSNTKGEHEDNDNDNDDDDDTNVKSCSSSSSSPERDTAIRDLLPRLRVAIQGLPGITASYLDETQIETAMQRYADGAGKVNRDAFTKILDVIRRNDPQGGGNTTPSTSRVTFRLTATIISGTSLRTVQFNTNNAMYAIGLSMRYTIPIQAKLLPAAAATTSFEEKDAVSSTSSLVSPIDMILEKFPAYRPIYELYEDAKIMDGFIPSMFQQTKKIDNDMKE